MGGVKPKVGPKKMRKGGAAKKKPVPADNKGLAKLPTEVRNKMGYMRSGGAVKKMRSGGAVKKMAKGGAAVRSACPSKGL